MKNKGRVEGRWKVYNQCLKKNTILKQNPAYIPRKGAFLEHDLRMDPDAYEKQGQGRG